MDRIWRVLTRKKAIDPVTAEETRLNRVLNTFDLTALGVGSTLGVGVYVLAGQIAKDTAGPSVILSFLIAAVASMFAALCYAEFGARAPRAGSAYIYSYVCVGEFIAFIIGWNLILEYVIGSASVAKALSLYLDTLINNTLQNTFREIAPIHVDFMGEYFDFFSFGVSILLAVALAFGMKESSIGNNIVTVLNLLTILFVIIAGSLKADPSNWHVSPDNTTTNSTKVGKGGFFPFGVEGMIKGAATAFYGFVGFDCIATTGEEVRNPRKAIPISIIVSLFIVFFAYFGVGTVLTLMVPYYLQDHDAPIPRAFETIGWEWAKWVVSVGALFGLCASLFGAMFPLPRIIYAMGSDGLVFKFLAKVHPKFQTPVIGTITAGLLTGLMSAVFDLKQLVNMMSIGTLLAYTIVAASVLLLRYNDDTIRQNFDGPTTSDETELISNEPATCCRHFLYIFNYQSKEPNRITENIVAVEVFIYCLLCLCIGLCIIFLPTPIMNKEIWAIAIASAVIALTTLVVISIATQPTSKKELSFKVPLVPLVPALSIMVNIYLMLMLDFRTWIRFALWMALGLPMYYICACTTQNNPDVVANGTNYSNNITNGHTKLMNGLENPTFKHDAKVVQDIVPIDALSKKKVAPSPPIEENVETIHVQEDAVIAQLDEVLESTLIDWDEDRLSDETIRINNRKLSLDSVSNVSLVLSHSENVIADVHRSDLSVTVPPLIHDEIIQSSNPNIIEEDHGNLPQIVNANSSEDKVLKSLENVEDINNNGNSEEGFAAVELLTDLDDNTTGQYSITDVNIESNTETNNVVEILTDPDDNTTAQNSITDDNIESTTEANNVEILTDQDDNTTAQNSIKDDNIESTTESSHVQLTTEEKVVESVPNITLPPPPPLPEETSEVTILPPVPTEEALRTVTLRHVQKASKEIVNMLNENASDDNLKFGTETFKKFTSNLDNKLKKRPATQSLYLLPKTYIVRTSKEFVKNENVIEDQINREEARNKLKDFLESDNQKRTQVVLERSSSTDNIIELKKDNSRSEQGEDDDKKEHQYKMKHVFNSLKLNDIKTNKSAQSSSKTLGSSYREDPEGRHKIKMNDIFKSINALRPETE